MSAARIAASRRVPSTTCDDVSFGFITIPSGPRGLQDKAGPFAEQGEASGRPERRALAGAKGCRSRQIAAAKRSGATTWATSTGAALFGWRGGPVRVQIAAAGRPARDAGRDMEDGMGRVTAFVAVFALAAAGVSPLPAETQQSPMPTTGEAELAGVVRSANGPEAGVWVIAETTDFPTKLAKIVVTDDAGRYLIPDLPKGSYSVWVRGYGLVDSAKVQAAPGRTLDLEAMIAPSPAAAAEYYPAIYWYSMLKVPEKQEFGAGGANGGMPAALKVQAQWIDVVKTNGCYGCHALGTKATRTLPPALGEFGNSAEAWERRIQSGQAMTQMVTNIGRLDAKRALGLFADWTDRIAAGELPAAKPPRPQGVERNVVLTVWDWAGPRDYLHDLVSTDKRKPTVNPNGPVYGATEESTDLFPILDPVSQKATQARMPVRDPNTPSSKDLPMAPSAYWGPEPIWDSQTTMHNPMFDEKGRVWFTSRVQRPETPDFCRKGSEHPSAKLFPLERANRNLSMY